MLVVTMKRITASVITSAEDSVRFILSAYGMTGATVSGFRLPDAKNTTKFNGKLRVDAAFPNGYIMRFQGHDLDGLRVDVVSQCADTEYSRWLWSDAFRDTLED